MKNLPFPSHVGTRTSCQVPGSPFFLFCPLSLSLVSVFDMSNEPSPSIINSLVPRPLCTHLHSLVSFGSPLHVSLLFFKTHGKWVPWCLGQILTVGHKSTFLGGTSVPASQAQDSPHIGEWSLLKSYAQFLQFSSSFRRSRSRSWWPGMQENTSEEMTHVSSDKSILWGKIALSRHRR